MGYDVSLVRLFRISGENPIRESFLNETSWWCAVAVLPSWQRSKKNRWIKNPTAEMDQIKSPNKKKKSNKKKTKIKTEKIEKSRKKKSKKATEEIGKKDR